MYDLIILGGSAAGVMAAVYAARRKVNLRLLANDFGGGITMSPVVENFLGFNKISGFELAQKMKEQLDYNQAPYDLGFVAQKIKKEDGFFLVSAKNSSGEEKTYETKTIVVATGAHPRHLNIPGETEFFHKGVTYCALCDAPLFKNKIVAVVGGGNSALTSALMLAEFAAKIYIIDNQPRFIAEKVLLDKALGNPKIEPIHNAKLLRIVGEKFVQALEYEDAVNQEIKKVETQGVFVNVGWEPTSEFIDFVEKNKNGEIVVDARGATSAAGVFAAGDVTDAPYKQLITAAGRGAAAALSAIDYLNKLSGA